MRKRDKRLTISQSSFERVTGRARRNPLNVFSLIAAYVSPNEVWYFPSSTSISAKIFDADAVPPEVEIDGGRAKEILCVVDNCT